MKAQRKQMIARSLLNNALKTFYIILYTYINVASTQANKLMAAPPERREELTTQVQFRYDILESQKRVNYQSEFDTHNKVLKHYQHYNPM